MECPALERVILKGAISLFTGGVHPDWMKSYRRPPNPGEVELGNH